MAVSSRLRVETNQSESKRNRLRGGLLTSERFGEWTSEHESLLLTEARALGEAAVPAPADAQVDSEVQELPATNLESCFSSDDS